MRDAFGTVAVDDVEPGWEERWRDFHRSVRIGPLWLGVPWEEPPADALTVVIDPGRAFGTGGHPTTRLCVEQLGALEPGSLLDVGCGSGVLSIAAARLGFAPVYAVDVDPLAVEATRENAARNAVELTVERADAFADELPSTDVVVANISLASVEELAPRLRAERLVASGYLEDEQPRPEGYRSVVRRTSARWAADLFVRVGS